MTFCYYKTNVLPEYAVLTRIGIINGIMIKISKIRENRRNIKEDVKNQQNVSILEKKVGNYFKTFCLQKNNNSRIYIRIERKDRDYVIPIDVRLKSKLTEKQISKHLILFLIGMNQLFMQT
jgi:hypothetical protein